MKHPSDCQNIDEIRNAIDELDTQIIQLLGKRFKYVKCVVQYKEKNIDSIVAKERLEAVINSRRNQAEANGLNADVVEKMYRLLINYFIEEELKILKSNQ
ncbi:MAG: isochorismate-pyruvate lyase [Bacteroidales bacterium]|nr:isochorismate-pyruvate lyase [Bacteroidales bacterium]